MGTLVYSSKHYPKSLTMQIWECDPVDRLFSRIVAEKCKTKLIVTRNMYAYIPSDEYKQVVTRLKGIRK
jgi:hypothetical protein